MDANKLIELSKDFICTLNFKGEFTFSNQACSKILGYTPDEIMGRNFTDFIHVGDIDRTNKALENILTEQEIINFENRYIHKNSSIKHLSWQAYLNLNEKLIYAIGRDITNCKQVEDDLVKLKENAERMKHEMIKTLELAHIGNWYLDIASNRVTWTEELYKMYGFDPTLPVPPYTEHMKLFTPESWDILSLALENTRITGAPYELELRTIKKEGDNGWMWVHGEAIKNDQGKTIALWGVAQDISEHKKSEISLKESEEKYRMMFQLAGDAAQIIHDNKFVDYNDKALSLLKGTKEQLLGLSPWDLSPKFQADGKESKQKANEKMQAAMAGSAQQFEWQHMRLDGTILDVEVSLNIIDREKNICISIWRDITKRKRAEDALKANEEKYRLIDNASKDFIYSYDLDGRFTHANPNLVKFYNLPADKIIGKTHRDLQYSMEVCQEWDELHQKVYKINSTIYSETTSPDRNGELRNYEVILNPLHNTEGTIIGIAGVTRDITERKQAEEKLKASIEREKELADIVRKASIAIAYGYADGRLENCNAAFTQLTGYSSTELKQINWNEVLTPPKWRKYEGEKLSRISALTNSVKYEKEYIRKDGSIVPIELFVTAKFDSHGNILHYIAFITDITQRKLTEIALLSNQQRYEKAQAMGHVGNWEYNPVTTEFWGSDEAKRIYGFDIDSKAFTTDMVESCIIERERIHQALIDLIENNKQYNLVFDILTYDKGIRKTIHSIAETARDNEGNILKITGVISDITERKQVENELLKAKEKAEKNERENKANANFIKAIIESSAISTWISDKNGTAIMTNPACLNFFGATEEEVIGKYNLFKDSEIEKHGFMPLIHDLFEKGKSANFIMDYNFAEVDHVNVKQATHKIINTIATPIIDLNRQVSNVIVQTIDLTEIKKNETELKLAKEKAEESDRLKSAFLTNMSHEIRTPLNAVLGFSELLTRSNITEKEKTDFSEYIRLNGESLAKIIDDIIDISKLQLNQLTISNSIFNLRTLFNELYNYYCSYLIQKSKSHIKLILELPSELNSDFYIETDEQRLKQILNNLVSNAIKYTEKGQIAFGCKIENSKLYFFVNDTGFGIGSENIAQIFERFVQFSPKYASKQEGTGLGLSICKNLAALLGGELKVNSKINEGSTFHFHIPLIRAEKPKQGNNDSIINLNNDLSKYKILIADDEVSNYVLTKRMLQPSKVAIDWAQNGKNAINMALINHYDLILMDIKMPEIDGIEATRIIKKQNIEIPIIIQTAFAMKEVKDEALEAGCDGFIVKPIALDAFLELVNRHIKIS